MEKCLTTSKAKTHKQKIWEPKLGLKLGFLSFPQGYIISFLIFARLQPPKKLFVDQIGTKIIFSILMLSSVHSNLLVLNGVLWSKSKKNDEGRFVNKKSRRVRRAQKVLKMVEE